MCKEIYTCIIVDLKLWECAGIRRLSGNYPSIFEYLENRSRGLDVTWQPEDTLQRISEHSLSSESSQLAVRRHWLASVVCDRRIHSDRASRLDNAPAHPIALIQAFLAKHYYHPAPLHPWFGSLPFTAFPTAKIAVEMDQTVTLYTNSAASSCRLTSPTGVWLFTDAQWSLLWLAATTRPVLDIFKMDGCFPGQPSFTLSLSEVDDV